MKGQYSVTFDDPERRNEVRLRYLAGETCKEIGAHYGCSESPVRNVLRMMKVDMRGGSNRRRHATHARGEEREEAAQTG